MVVPQSLLVDSKADPWQVQLLDIIDWRWVTNPVVLSSTTFTADAMEKVSRKNMRLTEGPKLAKMMTGCVGDTVNAVDEASDDGAGPRCDICRCSGEQATARALELGTEVAKYFEGGLREGYCCVCYDKCGHIVQDIQKKSSLFETPAIGVATSIQTADGIGIFGMRFSVEKVVLNGIGEVPVPTPRLLGVPLVAKRVPGTDTGDADRGSMNLIVRFMSDPNTGLAPPDWQYGQGLGDPPKVLLARTDGKPFTVNAWAAIDDYMVSVFDEEDPAHYKRKLTKSAFGRFLHGYHMPIEPSFINLAFPKTGRFQIQHVQSDDDLNGQLSTVLGWKSNGRVKVKVDSSNREIALKPHNLRPERY
jgi:hypothetical protein